jgi:FKBP-type peptidyl-prolyl cis-trans isomerase
MTRRACVLPVWLCSFVLFLLGSGVVAGHLGRQAPADSTLPAPPLPSDLVTVPDDAIRAESGLAWRVLERGEGDQRPGPTDLVTIHYTGWRADGEVFDSTAQHGRPSVVSMERLMAGMREAISQMAIGERRRLWVPTGLALAGEKGQPSGMVVIDVELLDIVPSPAVPPPDVEHPPEDAARSESGLAWKVLRAGTGSARPRAQSRVIVHYTGWTTDGRMFDSSIVRGRPAELSLEGVIEGWTEGVQMLVVGEKRRFWIPQDLAYRGRAGAPRGMLVFDIELIGIQDEGR